MEEHGEAGIIMKLCRRAKEYAGAVAWNWLGNNILHGYTFGKLKKNTDYMKLSESCGKDGERVVLLDTPLHGNLGDQAIALAEREFIGEIVGVDRLFEFTSAECRANLSDIVKKITEKDIVVIHGGGFIGTLWPEEEKVFLRILDCLKEKRIIVFPQTIYFDRTKAGKRELRRFIHAVKACRDITVFARDRKSYIWLKNGEILPSHKFYLVPDIVMSYQKPHDERSKRKKIVWLCLRRDQEKMLDDSVLKVLMVKLKASGYCVELTDTVVEGKINPKERGDAVNEKLNRRITTGDYEKVEDAYKSYLRDNFDDKTKEIEENEDYMDQGEKKKLFDETFMLQYLILKTLDQDEAENEGTKEEIKETILEQMVNNLVDMDQDLTEEELNKLIANKYEVIKYKKMEAIKEIQKIFRDHIDKYLTKIEKED